MTGQQDGVTDRCGKLGHVVKDCHTSAPSQSQNQDKRSDPSGGGKGEQPKKDLKEIQCYNCNKKGHYSANYPQKAMLCSDREVRSME